MENEKVKINNPIIKIGVYALMALVLGIGCAWVLLGVLSPVLLILLIQRW
jgi:hypothetical protein